MRAAQVEVQDMGWFGVMTRWLKKFLEHHCGTLAALIVVIARYFHGFPVIFQDQPLVQGAAAQVNPPPYEHVCHVFSLCLMGLDINTIAIRSWILLKYIQEIINREEPRIGRALWFAKNHFRQD